jgi:imidazolonepropionase-like amidohydrolase
MLRVLVFALASAALVVALVGAQQTSAPAPGVVALVNANLVDVRQGRVTPRATLVVRGAVIESIGQAAPAGAQVVDVAGKFVVPGLIDAHTHVSNLRALRNALESGVTTARSSGASSYVDVGMRELVRNGAVPGPEMIASGYHVRPRLAEEAFLSSPELAVFMRPPGVASADAIRRVVRVNLAHGVDWIKVLATERAGTADTDPREQVYTEDELRAAVETATEKGIPVQAHAHGDEGAMAAVRAGVRSIEHGTYLSDATLRLMKEKGTYLDPTYTTVVDLVEPGGDYDTAPLRIRGQHMLPRLADTVTRAHKLGVKIVTGADTSYGPNSVTRIAQEVENFVQLGMTSVQALQSATVVAAEMLRVDARTGAIAPGFEADLLVVESNPLEHPRTLQDALLVMSNGVVAVNRLDMRKAGKGTD